MDLASFEKHLAEKIEPIYTFVGDQSFLTELMVEAIKEKVLPSGGFADMNFDNYYVSEKGALSRALDTARQLPMMAKQRMVVIRECEKIKSGAETDMLVRYLEAPNEFCVLVTCFSKLNKSTKPWKRSNSNGLAIAFGRLYDRDMPPYVKKLAEKQGKKISPDAVSYMVRVVGPNLGQIASELEKAAIYVGEGDTINAADIEAVLASVKAESVFDLTDAVGGRNQSRALFLIKQIVDSGEAPLRLLFQISNHMKRLMLVRSLLIKGLSPDQIGSALGLAGFVRDKLLTQSKAFSRKELRDALIRLTKADLELKSGRISDRAVLEKLILDLCSRQKSLPTQTPVARRA